MALVITGGRFLLPEGVRTGLALVVRDGRIAMDTAELPAEETPEETPAAETQEKIPAAEETAPEAEEKEERHTLCVALLAVSIGPADYLMEKKASFPGYCATSKSSSSMRSSWLYFATRSEREGAPVFIWQVLSATARSAIVVSAVSPER